MMKKALVLIFLLLILSGCDMNDDQLDFPRSLHLNQEVLSWDAVEDATFYTLNINGETYDTSELFFNLNFLDNGSYEIKILAYYGYIYSEYSPVFNVIFDRDYMAPQNVMIVDEVFLTWDAIEFITSYSIWMDDEEVALTWVPSYDLSLLTLNVNQSHSFQVTGNYGVHATLKSTSLEYTYLPRIGNTLLVSYTLNQNEQVIIELENPSIINSVWFESEFISSDLFTQSVNTQIEFNPSIFESLSVGTYEMRLLTSIGYIAVHITIE
ncbi:MAG: hypothetical protein K9L02_05915 [Acholeplasmataceae bacterium]|nr:hypothetical protein [Acholeplasmataceae bacterium]